jgi:uncharacterized DUF497 family protein
MIEFDPAKDAANIAKHGVSLARAADLEVLVVVEDARFEEQRFRATAPRRSPAQPRLHASRRRDPGDQPSSRPSQGVPTPCQS